MNMNEHESTTGTQYVLQEGEENWFPMQPCDNYEDL